MIAAPIPSNEKERLDALKRYEILDTDAEKDLEEIVQLASAICQTPISLVSLIDENRQWFKARTGIDVPETIRDVAFCSHVLLEKDVMVVENALEDKRFADNPLVTSDPNIRFYAGAPLVTPDGFKLGTLCVIDKQPRKLNAQQLFALKTLSKQVIKHFELSLQNKKLQELSKLQNRFLSILSHDMKNPLIGIDGLLSLMNSGDISREDFRELTDEASDQIKLVLNLLNDIMGWANSTETTELIKTKINLRELVKKPVVLLASVAAQKNNELDYHIPENMEVTADEAMLNFILRNLLTNANKFTENGKITVNAEETATLWKITIADTGLGMSEEHVARLLNPKKRVTTSGTKNEKGTGLGLLLSNEFIKKHGGTLSINSKKGVGSTFTFTLSK
ncbi:MAG: GAF domain-containing sensor histidine kinase [Bacteroidia bacterium]|nr:GAF domain-containing sensor histidine kinase [Bacteroidia bacterium]MBP7259966.1 GAF domain-containing sensor histidine kinase [Bacteroidia bacterium]MBP9181209.1 GAF domain-containing sensor histidine kinase [Bacteroidia bacterium]MBP9725790.1 GAF domain-containing sensor histidine kinase [Bacteroidia bacterium]